MVKTTASLSPCLRSPCACTRIEGQPRNQQAGNLGHRGQPAVCLPLTPRVPCGYRTAGPFPLAPAFAAWKGHHVCQSRGQIRSHG